MASGKKQAKVARLDERAERIRRQAELERRNRNYVIAGFATLIVGGTLLLYGLTNPDKLPWSPKPTPAATPAAAYSVPEEGFTHILRPARASYKHSPPSSGNHYSDTGAPRPWAPYKDALLPEEWIHNLEHGGIVLVYTCDSDCDTQFAAAQQVAQNLPPETKFHEIKFLSTPYVGSMPKKFALLAWDKEQDMDSMDVPTITAFYNAYVDHGREDLA